MSSTTSFRSLLGDLYDNLRLPQAANSSSNHKTSIRERVINQFDPADFDETIISQRTAGNDPKEGRLNRKDAVRFAFGFFVVVAMALVAWPFLPRRYEATATLTFYASDSRQLRLDYSAVEAEIDRLRSGVLLPAMIARQPKIVLSEIAPGIGQPGGGAGDTRPPEDEQAVQAATRRRLASRLKVAHDKNSYNVSFGFTASQPSRALAMTDALLQAFVEDQSRRNDETIKYRTRQIRDRVAVLNDQYKDAQRQFQKFHLKTGLGDNAVRLSLERQLTTLSVELAQTRSQAIEFKLRADLLSRMLAAGAIEDAPEVLSSTPIQRLKEAAALALSKPTSLRSESTAIESQLHAESVRIVNGAQKSALNWAERERLLNEQVETLRAKLSTRRELEFDFESIQRRAANSRAILDDAERQFERQMGEPVNIFPKFYASSAEMPQSPSFPNPVLVSLATIVAGLLVGLAMIWPSILALAMRLGER